MEEVIKNATQLLRNGEPEEALLLLKDIEAPTLECGQLEAACKHTLSQQYIYLLREASKEGELDIANEIVLKYKKYIGDDERINQLLEDTKAKNELKKAELSAVEQQRKILEKKERKEQQRNNILNYINENVFPITFGVSLFFLAIGLLIARIPYKQLRMELWSANKSLNEVQRRNNYLRNDIEKKSIEIQNCWRRFEEEVQVLKDKVPLLITDIQIGAATDDPSKITTAFGNTLYSNNTTFLVPQISFYGLIDGNVELKVKWYNARGHLTPYWPCSEDSRYSVSKIECKKNMSAIVTLDGWGCNEQGTWLADDYRIEIWYEDVCLKKFDFTINH